MGRHAGADGPDLALWESVTTAYRTRVNGRAPAPGTNQRTEAARARSALATEPGGPGATTIDLYVDPVCPYTWTAACWLREVAQLREVEVRHHVMSLHLLNAGGVLENAFRGMVGPSRVATAVVAGHGPESLAAWHREFGSRIFDHWRYPSRREYRAASAEALAAVGLPPGLEAAAETGEYDDVLLRSTEEATLPVGPEVGTPIVHVDGVAFFGPVLNAVPLGDAALRVLDGVRLLASSPEFFEVRRSRTSPPEVRYQPDHEDGGTRP